MSATKILNPKIIVISYFQNDTYYAGHRKIHSHEIEEALDNEFGCLKSFFQSKNIMLTEECVLKYFNCSDNDLLLMNLQNIAKSEDLESHDCFMLFFIGISVEEGEFSTNGATVNVSKVVSSFKSNVCKGLFGKPKMFFFQLFQGIDCFRKHQTSFVRKVKSLPADADLFIALAEIPLYWKGETMMSAMDKMGKIANIELSQLATRLNGIIVNDGDDEYINEDNCSDIMNIPKCSFWSMLRNFIYL